ncbi:RagB/SusD family nutrient uptake outer membrane protein [Pseudoflavitalea rhizosphaerae]|uniref:RagB/SusD family nutrient uptake outer membrane protein n=1 Tax=Pseudoflavitalea rhizosphaerae TaxID=1884793 RepID=UPI000F8F0E1A|nr:RagB/SusD family nutrient uptake outer membrane protein [Pseudoflavitalea rhizosphaerae]
MNNNISHYINKVCRTLVVPAALLSLGSCTKALEETPYSFYSPENFYKNESDAKIAMNGVYSALYTWEMYQQPFWNLTVLDDDHVSGADWFLGTSGAGNPQGYWGVDGPWVGCYTIIGRANTVLENVGKLETEIDAEIKQRILGECYFLRGWAYFQLVQLYGGVPIRTKTLSEDPERNRPRSSVEEVYAAIIEDFKKAETMLFPAGHAKAGEPGRVTRGLAKGMLAKTYLTMASGAATGNVSVRGGQDNGYYTYPKNIVAGYENIDSKHYAALARDKAMELIQDNEYSLYDSWKELWAKGSRNRREHMWEVQSMTGTPFMNNLHNYFSALSTFGRGATWFTNHHYLDYEDADLRVLDGVVHNYATNTGTKYFYPSWQAAIYKNINGVVYNNNGTTDDRAYVIKYADVSDPTLANSDAYFPLMRYSEIYLIYAEAANEANDGPTAEAYTYLKKVRDRAHATEAPANMDKEQFRSFVIAERAREFALEGVRRFDLMRWGIYLQVMNKIGTGQNNISKVRASRNLLLPIPLSEINSNQSIPDNNPGW